MIVLQSLDLSCHSAISLQTPWQPEPSSPQDTHRFFESIVTDRYRSLFYSFNDGQPLHGLHPYMILPFNFSIQQIAELSHDIRCQAHVLFSSAMLLICSLVSSCCTRLEWTNKTEVTGSPFANTFISAAVSAGSSGCPGMRCPACQAIWSVAACHRCLCPEKKNHT